MENSKVHPPNKGSGTALKWVICITAIGVAVVGILLALICIYAIPSKTPHPLAAGVCFLGSVSIIVCLVIFSRKRPTKE
ncbi:MAG: hypothetical protein JRJ47_08045 [Deltaproteobacteria bacterium]|nr:hypothetical protein [Deltaproteobacteria bacterium]